MAKICNEIIIKRDRDYNANVKINKLIFAKTPLNTSNSVIPIFLKTNLHIKYVLLPQPLLNTY